MKIFFSISGKVQLPVKTIMANPCFIGVSKFISPSISKLKILFD
jgi:hypothetical protein